MTLTIDWNNPTFLGTLQGGGVISSWYKVDLVTPSIILTLKDKTPRKPWSISSVDAPASSKLQSIQYPPGMEPKKNGDILAAWSFESLYAANLLGR